MTWKQITLGQAVETSSGTWGQPPTGRGDTFVLRSTNIHDGRLVLDDVASRSLTPRLVDRFRLCAGDIIVTTSSGSSRLIGKSALFEQPADGRTYVLSNFTLRLRPNAKALEPRFLQYYLLSPAAKAELDNIHTTTSGLRNLNVKQYLLQPLPFPALSEQRRIVKILDHSDRLQLQRKAADAKALGVLGTLFLHFFGDANEWQADPIAEPLGNLVDSSGGGTPSKKVPEYWDGVLPWVSPKDMKRDFIADAEDHITQRAVDETTSRLISSGSILVVVRGMILARHVPIAITTAPVAINQDMKALRVLDERVSPLYVFAALRSLSAVLHARVGTAGHGTRKLDTERLMSLRVRIPDKRTHEQFIRCFEALRVIDARRESVGPRIEALFQSLLHRAFTGELTARWREAHEHQLEAEIASQLMALGNTRADTMHRRAGRAATGS